MSRFLVAAISFLLGLAVISPAEPLADPQIVKIMTYNIYWGGQDHDPVFGRHEEWLQVIKSRNPDVILIEEANGWLPSEDNLIEAYVDSLNDAFPDDPPYEGYVGDATGAFNVALISRIPVLLFEQFNEVDIGDEIVQIAVVFIHAVLDAYNGQTHVVGIHFKSGSTNREQREKEARALLTILDGLPPGETVWVGGDFNSYSPVDIDPESPTQPDYGNGAQPPEVKGWEPIGYLLDRGYIDAFRTLHPLELGYTQGTLHWPGLAPVQRVDAILRSPGGPWSLQTAETLADSLGHIASDHYAVFATYQWDPISSVGSPPDVKTSSIRVLPNPTAGSSQIHFNLSGPSPVGIKIFSASGRLVRDLLSSDLAAGVHDISWDGTDSAGHGLPDGVYFLRLATNAGKETARVHLSR